MPSSGKTMTDEYGKMNSDGFTACIANFKLESGQVLPKTEARYMTWGTLNAAGSNVLVICHALTGNANVESWWGSLLGPRKPFDTSKYFVFCANVLGGCYGSTGPNSEDAATGERMGAAFPKVTIRDMVYQQIEVLKQLGVREIVAAVGGSMGGMTALEFCLCSRDDSQAPYVRSVITLSSSGRHQPWQIGISEVQRAAIYADPKWKDGMYGYADPPKTGLGVARMMAMVTYRTHPAYWTKFGRDSDQEQVGSTRPEQKMAVPSSFEVESYLRAQGRKFFERGFDAGSYVRLTEAMDSHDIGRNRGGYYDVLRSIKIPILIASISSDVLYPVSEQLELAEFIPTSQHHMVESPEGHDGFLLEGKKIGLLIRGFLGQMEYEDPALRGPRDQALLTVAKL